MSVEIDVRDLQHRVTALEAELTRRRAGVRARSDLLVRTGKLCPVLAVLALAGWAVGQGVEIKTSDGAADQTRFKVESGLATVSAYFLNAAVGIGTNNPGDRLHLSGDSTYGFLVDNQVTFRAKNSTGTKEAYLWPRWNNDRMYLNYGANGLHIRPNGAGTDANTALFVDNAKSVGIGTITPLAKLHVASGTGVNHILLDKTDDSNYVEFLAGTQVSGVKFGDQNRFAIGVDTYANRTNTSAGTECLTILPTGEVGMGTIAPSSKLEVVGSILASGADPLTMLYHQTSESGNPNTFGDGVRLRYQGDYFGGTSDAFVIEKTDSNGVDPDGGIAFANTGNDGVVETSMVIKGQGYVGIGTTTPGAPLEVTGKNTGLMFSWNEAIRLKPDAHAAIYHAGGDILFGLHGNRNFYWADNTNSLYTMSLTPLSALTLHQATTTNATFGRYGSNPASTWLYLTNGSTGAPAYADLAVGDHWTNGIGYHIGQAQYRYLGNTILVKPSAMLAGELTRIRFEDPDGGTGPINLTYVDDGSADFGITGGGLGIGTTNPAYQLELTSNSAGKPTSNTWTISSDARLKKDVEPFTDGLDVVRGIRPIRYRYNGLAETPENDQGIGILAQEIREVAPYTVGTYRRKLHPDDAAETELLSFDSHALTFVAVNAMKELDARLAALEGARRDPPAAGAGSGSTPSTAGGTEEVRALRERVEAQAREIEDLRGKVSRLEALEERLAALEGGRKLAKR